MLALAIYYIVITKYTFSDPPQIEFKAQSPDEVALVSTMCDCGFTILSYSSDDLLLNVMGEECTYTILNTLEFNSFQKQISTIICMPNSSICLFYKGANSIIYSYLAYSQ